jgi:hypothetical protein
MVIDDFVPSFAILFSQKNFSRRQTSSKMRSRSSRGKRYSPGGPDGSLESRDAAAVCSPSTPNIV